MEVDALFGVARSRGGAVSVLVFALSALRRAGFFRGFLFEAVVDGRILGAVALASTEAIVPEIGIEVICLCSQCQCLWSNAITSAHDTRQQQQSITGDLHVYEGNANSCETI
jgi:hypothetical protein